VLGFELPHLCDASRPGFRRRDVTHPGTVTVNDARRDVRPRLITHAPGDSATRGIPDADSESSTAEVNSVVIDSLHSSQWRRDKRFWF